MKKCFLLIILFFAPLRAAEAPKEITLWHAFEGFLKEVFEEIIEDFNHHSGAYRVVPMQAGNYHEVVKKGMDSFKEGKHPHILQIYEVATLTAMNNPKLFVPVDELMGKFHKKFDKDVYIDAVRNFYTSPEGNMMSLPWNASTGILFYNKQAFAKAGLDPNVPPKTWEEFEKMAGPLKQSGYIGYTTAWPAAYHLEHVCCLHNLPFERNGKLAFNGKEQVHHLSKVVDWKNKGYFAYSGRFTTKPEELFASEQCAILLQGANRLALIKRQVNFDIGVGFMPYWKSITDRPFSLNIGGSSFWVMEGFSDEEYRGIVQFFKYLSLTEVQAFWHQKTGYLPITDAAYYLTKKKGFYVDNPAAEIAVLEVMGYPPSQNIHGIRLPNYMEVREKIIEYLEKAFDGKLLPQEALDKAVETGNKLLY